MAALLELTPVVKYIVNCLLRGGVAKGAEV